MHLGVRENLAVADSHIGRNWHKSLSCLVKKYSWSWGTRDRKELTRPNRSIGLFDTHSPLAQRSQFVISFIIQQAFSLLFHESNSVSAGKALDKCKEKRRKFASSSGGEEENCQPSSLFLLGGFLLLAIYNTITALKRAWTTKIWLRCNEFPWWSSYEITSQIVHNTRHRFDVRN